MLNTFRFILISIRTIHTHCRIETSNTYIESNAKLLFFTAINQEENNLHEEDDDDYDDDFDADNYDEFGSDNENYHSIFSMQRDEQHERKRHKQEESKTHARRKWQSLPPLVCRDGRFVCDCGKKYKEERYLRYHQKWECGKLPSFHCAYCPYKAKRKNSMKGHLSRRHNCYDEPEAISIDSI